MQDYFRILHEGDVDGIKSVFMPFCDLSCPQDDGTIAHMSLEEYIGAVSSRTAPRDAGYPRFGRLVSIDQSGPNTAFVKVDCAVQPRYFTDYLSLVKDRGTWRIAAKVYTVTKVEE